MWSALIGLCEKGLVPDFLIRYGIRTFLFKRLASLYKPAFEEQSAILNDFVEKLKTSASALETDKANLQHYEVPAAFYEYVLGTCLKYSSCYFEGKSQSLNEAEKEMLRMTCRRADIKDGQTILDLGCGWGSLTLWIASNYKNCQIVSVSNSHSQAEFIKKRAQNLNLEGITVLTRNMAEDELEGSFDRVLSIEMFEHMRNYKALMHKVSQVLKPEGLFFLHIFVHRTSPYLFETEGADNWMGRTFFSGGMMPTESLLSFFQEDLYLQKQWKVNGTHYQKTAEKWLDNMDAHESSIMQILREVHGDEAGIYFHRWRIFFMACSELFGFRYGQEWYVSHSLFGRK